MKGRILKGMIVALALIHVSVVQAGSTGQEAPATTERKDYAPAGCMACHQSDNTADDERSSESE